MTDEQNDTPTKQPEKVDGDNEVEEEWDDEEDEELDVDSSGLLSDWKQHSVAVLVALVAALLGFFHLQNSQQVLDALEDVMDGGHAHIEGFERTSAISLCEMQLDERLISMDTILNHEHLKTMEHFYRADQLNDDVYQQVHAESEGEMDHPELNCARSANKPTLYSLVYKEPSIQQITRGQFNRSASLSYTGFSARFINLSNKPVLLHWDGRGGHYSKLVAEIRSMESVATVTTPGQSFFITPVYDHSTVFKRWTLTADTAIAVYEPEDRVIKPELRLKYRMQKLNALFARDYLAVTGRFWLSNFPRPQPLHHIWEAEYIGQVHKVTSSHGYFMANGELYDQPVELKLNVTSVVPRVLEIPNFLSAWECRHLVERGRKRGFVPSTVTSGDAEDMVDEETRNSSNAWLERYESDVTNQIFLRAADVTQIGEELLRHRDIRSIDKAAHHSISESIQLVHYNKSQEYTPHHDFVLPSVTNRHQSTRFCTLLIYLKVPKEGGETAFPRAVQPHRHDGLVVTPEIGKALLFYNMLPDGNMDDSSAHGSNAVVRGEKYVANLWIWDPIIN